MTHSSRFLVVTVFCSVFLVPCAAFAHKGAGEPLFVSQGGADQGRCLDEATPCRSLSYALSVAGKGAEIRLAEGTYAIENPEDLFHLVSGMIEVSGGFTRNGSRFATQAGVTTLTGVPPQFRQQFRDRGFNVVSDRKAFEGPKLAEAEKLVALHAQLKSGASPGPCVGGLAGDLACESVDLLAHFSFADVSTMPASATDVWGFVDLNTGREYAIVGYDIGTAVIDVTDPEDPLEVGFIDGQPAFWRDIKVHQLYDTAGARWRSYAYVSTDGSTDGLFVIDMSDLPHSVRKTGYVSDFSAAHNVYAAGTDYSTGISLTTEAPTLAISGSSLGGGGFRAYSLENPASPGFIASASASDYMHDAASLIISDNRKDTQCENAGDWCQVLLDFNETTVDVWDITSAQSPVRLSRTSYANAAYVHSGWWAEDRLHVLVHDELDEEFSGLNTTVRVFSIADLRNPQLVGEWSGPTQATDHNGFARGNRYYISNYSRGLTVLDITDPTTPEAVGSLDTYPFSDNRGFVGAWGAYPFYFSGTIAISDIDTGLYLARDRSLDVPQGRFSFASSSYAAEEGQTTQLVVQRSGGSTGSVGVGFEVVHATADSADYQIQGGTLDWADGDAGERTIDLAATNDGVEEGMERLLVRLVNPTGGATLDSPNVAQVFLSDPGAAPEVGFFVGSVTTAERGFATAILVLQRHGSATGAAGVDFAITDGDATAGSDFTGQATGTVSWPAGDGEPKNLLFRIVDDGSMEETEFFDVTLTNATGAGIRGDATATVEILNGRGFNVAPNAVAGASQTVVGGTVVSLDGRQSNDPDGDSLTFEWEQTSGPAVSLSDATNAVARFTSPSVTSDTMLQFRLTVTDPAALSDSATTTVTVTREASGGGGSGGGGVSVPFILFCLTVLAFRAACLRRTYRRGVA